MQPPAKEVVDPAVVLAGGTEITVVFADGDERETGREVVKVRQVAVRHIGRLAQVWGNEGPEIDIYCGRPQGWHESISSDTWVRIVELGRFLNGGMLGTVFGAARKAGKASASDGHSGYLKAFEWLISQNYSESDLLDYSPDKLELMFSLAKQRVKKERASQDLRTLRLLRTAILSVINEEGRQNYCQVDDTIEAELDDETPKEKQRRGLEHLRKVFRAIGAQSRN